MAYNFNPRHKATVEIKSALGTPGLSSLPIGTVAKNEKYESPCAQSYIDYNNCLRKTEFNRAVCRNDEKAVI